MITVSHRKAVVWILPIAGVTYDRYNPIICCWCVCGFLIWFHGCLQRHKSHFLHMLCFNFITTYICQNLTQCSLSVHEFVSARKALSFILFIYFFNIALYCVLLYFQNTFSGLLMITQRRLLLQCTTLRR